MEFLLLFACLELFLLAYLVFLMSGVVAMEQFKVLECSLWIYV
jgi:uncharacterized membrane protein